MKLRLIRHATLVVEIGGVRILVDPLLGPAGGQPPIPETPNPRPNPLVELPVPAEDVIRGVQAVLVTHLHPDHVDIEALRLLDPNLPLLCQENDAPLLARQGRTDLRPFTEETSLGPVAITRTGGRHGHGAIADELGPVSGYVLRADGEPTLYIAGDTVWCPDVEAALAAHSPDVVVLNCGAARFIAGDPITMDVSDVVAVCKAAPDALIVTVHMEAINHCLLSRTSLREGLVAEGIAGRVMVPADGETLELSFS